MIERGQFDPVKAFALRDNPFDPIDDLPDIENPMVIVDSLMKEPLQVHIEPKLMDLYCPEVASFADNEARFKNIIRMSGYSFDRPRKAKKQFVVFVRGSMGTGKTTLINVMRYWLKATKQPKDSPGWHFFEAWDIGDDTLRSEDQTKRLQELEQRVQKETHEGDYCCIVADNIVEGVEQTALKLFKKLRSRNKVFLFMETSKPELIDKRWDNTSHKVEPFSTTELSPDDAVTYVRHRVSYFREEDLIPVLGEHELFPFREDNIRQAVKSRHHIVGGDDKTEETITIRQLNEILNAAMQAKMEMLESSFDIATLPADEVKDHIIDVLGYYKWRMS